MSDKAINQVPAECAKLYQCGLEALEGGDADSSIASFVTALEKEPGFVACREALRRAQRKAAKTKIGFWKRILLNSRLSPALAEAEVLLHLRPLQTIAIAERVLNQDSENSTAHRLLAKAAVAAGLPGTAVLSLQELANEHPGNRVIKLELADALARIGHSSDAATIYGQMLKDNPQDRRVLRALQKIFVAPGMAEAVRHENSLDPDRPPSSLPVPPPPAQMSQFPSGAKDDAIIKRFEPMLVHCQRNTTVLKTLAEAYARKMMFDKSISCYQRALEVAGGKNSALEAAIAETKLKKLDLELSRLDPKALDYASRREWFQNQRLDCQWHAMVESR